MNAFVQHVILTDLLLSRAPLTTTEQLVSTLQWQEQECTLASYHSKAHPTSLERLEKKLHNKKWWGLMMTHFGRVAVCFDVM